MATCPICGPLLILPPALKGWGHPRWHGLCSHIAHLWANSNYAPRSGGDPLGGRVYVATLPTCGPLLILPPALKRWGSPGRQGLCSHLTHLWVTYDCAPAMKRWGPPRRQGLCSHLAHLWATSDSAPRFEAAGTPQAAGLCSHLAHLWATFDSAPRFEAVGTP